jgi:hypothetical protein
MRAIGTGCDQRVGSDGLEMKIRTGRWLGAAAARASRVSHGVARESARVGVEPDAKQALLQARGRRQARGVDDAVDAAIDHDRDVLEIAVATPIFCSITSTDMSPSSPRRTSISSTWATMTGASPRSARP